MLLSCCGLSLLHHNPCTPSSIQPSQIIRWVHRSSCQWKATYNLLGQGRAAQGRRWVHLCLEVTPLGMWVLLASQPSPPATATCPLPLRSCCSLCPASSFHAFEITSARTVRCGSRASIRTTKESSRQSCQVHSKDRGITPGLARVPLAKDWWGLQHLHRRLSTGTQSARWR